MNIKLTSNISNKLMLNEVIGKAFFCNHLDHNSINRQILFLCVGISGTNLDAFILDNDGHSKVKIGEVKTNYCSFEEALLRPWHGKIEIEV